MKSASISTLRNHLSEYLRRVRRGETVLVLDRDRPIARLEPVGESRGDLPACYHEAVKAGIVRPARKRDDALRTVTPPPRPKKPARLVEALMEERRAGR
jgi:prevent-host-death family protein